MTRQLVLYEVTKEPYAIVPVNRDVFDGAKTKLLHLGGNFNLIGDYLSDSLARNLHAFVEKATPSEARIFTLTIGDQDEKPFFMRTVHTLETPIEKEAHHAPEPYSEMIVDEALLPPDLLQRWQAIPHKARQAREMKAYFSNLRLTGFSHGSQLIQRIDPLMRKRLIAARLPTESLSAAAALSFAPTIEPVPDSSMQQLFMCDSRDPQLSPMLRQRLLADPSKYPLWRTGNVLCLGEKEKKHFTYEIQREKPEEGRNGARFISGLAPTWHDFFFTSNPPVQLLRPDLAFFTPSALGAVFREAASCLMNNGSERFSFSQTPILQRLLDPAEGEANKDRLWQWQKKCIRRYFTIADAYIKHPWRQRTAYLNRIWPRLTAAPYNHPFLKG